MSSFAGGAALHPNYTFESFPVAFVEITHNSNGLPDELHPYVSQNEYSGDNIEAGKLLKKNQGLLWASPNPFNSRTSLRLIRRKAMGDGRN